MTDAAPSGTFLSRMPSLTKAIAKQLSFGKKQKEGDHVARPPLLRSRSAKDVLRDLVGLKNPCDPNHPSSMVIEKYLYYPYDDEEENPLCPLGI